VILLDVETEQTVRNRSSISSDFNWSGRPAWRDYSNWAAEQGAFYFGEDSGNSRRWWFSYGGGATAGIPDQLFRSAGKFASLRRDSERKREEVNRHAGSMEGRARAEKTHRHLTGDYAHLLRNRRNITATLCADRQR